MITHRLILIWAKLQTISIKGRGHNPEAIGSINGQNLIELVFPDMKYVITVWYCWLLQRDSQNSTIQNHTTDIKK